MLLLSVIRTMADVKESSMEEQRSLLFQSKTLIKTEAKAHGTDNRWSVCVGGGRERSIDMAASWIAEHVRIGVI
jgi:hypothetical protein